MGGRQRGEQEAGGRSRAPATGGHAGADERPHLVMADGRPAQRGAPWLRIAGTGYPNTMNMLVSEAGTGVDERRRTLVRANCEKVPRHYQDVGLSAAKS